jgi:hypothetical protein
MPAILAMVRPGQAVGGEVPCRGLRRGLCCFWGGCVWTVISPGISWDADGLHLVPRFYLGVGLAIGGIVNLVFGTRSKNRGPDQH